MLAAIKEYEKANKGYVICRSPRAMQLSPEITALPWQSLWSIIDE